MRAAPLLRVLGIASGLLALATFAALAAFWTLAAASLPPLAGHARLAGLSASVTIGRDAAGVPTLKARRRTDLARALGYVHGQDRFFQMDLLRRAAAGELAALFGPEALPVDRTLRLHRFRAVAEEVVRGLDAPSRALLEAYAEGVNAGLASLGSRPPEYWILGVQPTAWSAADSVLCVHAMFLDLQDAAGHEQLQRALLRATLPQAAARFLEAGAPEWDAAIDGSRSEEPVPPTAQEYDLRALPGPLLITPPARFTRKIDLGSNNWAVAGMHTYGAAVIANDMHLNYRVPNIWYRARLIVEPGSSGEPALDATGVTLPGTLSIVAGSNGSIAWGFTNSYGQYTSVIRLVPVPDDPDGYATAAGPAKLRYVDEPIEVRGAPTEHLKVAMTPWGPVIGRDLEGNRTVLEWTAQDAAGVNVGLIALEQTRSAAEALAHGAEFGIPGQNLLVADRAGHIGWTIAGRLPLRLPAAEGVPQLSTDPQVGFQGFLGTDRQPRLLDPPGGLLWSANARVVGGESGRLIGNDGMDRGARSQQIANDLLAAARPFRARDSLAIQLDDRARFLEHWRRLLGEVIATARARGDHSQDATAAVLAGWSGHAAPSDAAYRWVRQFRIEVEARVFFMLIAPARARSADFEFEIPDSFEGPLWRMLSTRPLHLLAANYADWDALLLEALRASEQPPAPCRDLAGCTWGSVNAVRSTHPLSRALPFLAGLLDMPRVQLPGGHHDMPRIQGPDYGASERFSVAPGEESTGYFHMPGGQSGHPFSPYYRAGFEAWRTGTATPFLPGPAEHVRTLEP